VKYSISQDRHHVVRYKTILPIAGKRRHNFNDKKIFFEEQAWKDRKQKEQKENTNSRIRRLYTEASSLSSTSAMKKHKHCHDDENDENNFSWDN
jgi:hypothetical protein